MKFFTTPSSKNIIATLRIVTIEIPELTFLLILYFHGQSYLIFMASCILFYVSKLYLNQHKQNKYNSNDNGDNSIDKK